MLHSLTVMKEKAKEKAKGHQKARCGSSRSLSNDVTRCLASTPDSLFDVPSIQESEDNSLNGESEDIPMYIRPIQDSLYDSKCGKEPLSFGAISRNGTPDFGTPDFDTPDPRQGLSLGMTVRRGSVEPSVRRSASFQDKMATLRRPSSLSLWKDFRMGDKK